jgi:hypothetical protein
LEVQLIKHYYFKEIAEIYVIQVIEIRLSEGAERTAGGKKQYGQKLYFIPMFLKQGSTEYR